MSGNDVSTLGKQEYRIYILALFASVTTKVGNKKWALVGGEKRRVCVVT